ncbi:hypothetical protein DER45DRAFT_566261 [Fusarium avenaceum]|nr:hypothetical protein DER45DRAFT_566261 [Fusarium avenaceum]
MPEARCSDYRLSASALQKWLRNEFSDDTITVENVSGHYLFNLPDGSQLTPSHITAIDDLRTKKK